MTRSSDSIHAATTDVLIAGKVYSLTGADPEHLQRVAALLNQKTLEVRGTSGYRNLEPEYRALLMNINLADEYFQAKDEAEKLKSELDTKDSELYAARHELVSMKLKLENALKQQNVLEKRAEEWKNRYEELKANGGASADHDSES